MNITLVMIVRNEANVLDRCLKSASKLVDEIVVVDTGSTDDTLAVAKAYGSRTCSFIWNDHFAEARNFALDQSKTEWNLVLDADEYFTEDYSAVIRQFISKETGIGRVRRIDAFRDQHGVSRTQCFIPRILPNTVRYEGRIHEQVDSSRRRVNLPIDLQHDGYLNASRAERNIPLLRRELAEAPNNPYLLQQLAREYKGIEDFDNAYRQYKLAYE